MSKEIDLSLDIKYKKLSKQAVTPSYAKDGDAGLDITTIYDAEHDSYGNVVYRTGLAFEIPKGYAGFLFPRSSVSKKDLILANCVGVIDSGYRGEVIFKFKVTEDDASEIHQIYSRGEKIGQLIILEVPKVRLKEVQELSDSERGEGGFGSTGN